MARFVNWLLSKVLIVACFPLFQAIFSANIHILVEISSDSSDLLMVNF